MKLSFPSLSAMPMLRGRKTGLLALVVLLAVIASACGQKAAPASEKTAVPAETAKASDSVRKVKHAMGESDVPAQPKRVVILTNEGTEALLALGIKPVGAVKSWTGTPWYDHIKADLEGVQVVGDENQPNLEMIASLKPDLIIGNKLRQEKIYDQLKGIAPTVFSETLMGAWKKNFTFYAEAVNKKAEGDKIVANFDKRIDDFKGKAGDKLKQKVSVVRFMAGKTRVYLQNTFTGIIFEQIGIARSDFKSKETFAEDINKERLPEADADLLFYFTYETGDGKASKHAEEWMNDPLWKGMSVVKNGKAFKVSDAVWNTAGGVKAANLMLDELYTFYGIQK